MEALSLVDFSFSYPTIDDAPDSFPPTAAQPVIRSVSLIVTQGAFVTLCGMTGSGKSTLLRCLKHEVAPIGERRGTISVLREKLGVVNPQVSAAQVGLVMQDPASQIVMDTVWHELAFGLENLGVEPGTIHRRVAETASFFGIDSWFERKTQTLSGGQRQLLNLAAIMTMQPQILLLDEPTAQLDPIATKEFLQVLSRVNRELGTTVLIVEHRLEEVLPLSDQVVFLKDGAVAFDGTSQGFIAYLDHTDDTFIRALPAITRVALHVDGSLPPYPLLVREGRNWLATYCEAASSQSGAAAMPFDRAITEEGDSPGNEGVPSLNEHDRAHCALLTAEHVWFRYERGADFVLRDISLAVRRGEIQAIVGGNGSGKSTLLYALSGVHRPERGKVRADDTVRIAALAQDPKMLFIRDTLFEDLMESGGRYDYSEKQVHDMLAEFGLEPYADRHPYDLSGGEVQKAALAKLLLLKPNVLLLDEPAKGLDAYAKDELKERLWTLRDQGKAIVVVAHDLEFIAQTADRCTMLFNGGLIGSNDTRRFFEGNLFYTTDINRMARGLLPHCVTVNDVLTHV